MSNIVFTYDVECFERELSVVFPAEFSIYGNDIITLLNDGYDKWHAFEDIEDETERDYVQFSCLEEFMITELSKQFPEWIQWKSEYYGNEEEEDEEVYWIMNGRR